MKIKINDDFLEIEQGISISKLLNQQNLISKKGIAIALNDSVIPRTKWNEILLNENDKILVISATRGG